MKKTTARLSVHRNTIEKKRRNDLAKLMLRGGEKMIRDSDIRAFALVGIDSEGHAHAVWNTGGALPMWAFPETVASILKRDIETSGIADDWKPSLPVKG